MNGLVSAIITTYNREPELIRRSVESALGQTYGELEIIIVDDNPSGSEISQRVKQYIESYPQITYIKQNGNKGACLARNLGAKCAHGEYLAFLDDDDEWDCMKIQRQVQTFISKEDPLLGMVFCNGILATKIGRHYKKQDYIVKNVFGKDVSFKMLLRENCIGTTTGPLIKKSSFFENGGFLKDLPARQDYELWLRIAQRCHVWGINEKLFTHYVEKREQISGNPRKAVKGYQYIYFKYLRELYRDKEANISMLKAIQSYLDEYDKAKAFWLYVYIQIVKRFTS